MDVGKFIYNYNGFTQKLKKIKLYFNVIIIVNILIYIKG
jgi:hypothetical protein